VKKREVREKQPLQGLRSDFWYNHESHEANEFFMIWPEFEDQSGNVVLDDMEPVSKTGTAMMWIINDERRIYHRDKINVGMKGYFREGSITTAVCTVIEIIGLLTNPTTNQR
jgi:hypothetical protein